MFRRACHWRPCWATSCYPSSLIFFCHIHPGLPGRLTSSLQVFWLMFQRTYPCLQHSVTFHNIQVFFFFFSLSFFFVCLLRGCYAPPSCQLMKHWTNQETSTLSECKTHLHKCSVFVWMCLCLCPLPPRINRDINLWTFILKVWQGGRKKPS